MKWLADIGRGSSAADVRGGVGGILGEPRGYLVWLFHCGAVVGSIFFICLRGHEMILEEGYG